MDDDANQDNERPISPAKLSRTPSWVMLGFILGAVFVWLLPREPEPAAAPPALTARPPSAEPAAPTERRIALTMLTTIEAVFETWGEHAVWDGAVTEVALWSGATKTFSEFYEVRRSGGVNYFRSIPRLTRRIITHGKPPPTECPLQFTETEEQYREWREHGRTERRLEVAAPDSPPAAVRPPVAVPAVRASTPPPLEKPALKEPPKH
ncbi:MAG: hypothetical protein HZA93_12715 [Verrucomicrobia bacterium]|nr:hypothetical protein [Verrucomicrobiota bacterium]